MRRFVRALAAVAATAAVALPARPAGADETPELRRIHFPVDGPATFVDDFGDPRSGGRRHEGNDVMGQKLQPVLAAVEGRVTFARVDAGGLSGNMLTITDDERWQYRYIHLNNDTPGTDDGANPLEWVFTRGVAVGARVKAGQHIAFLGDSGNAEDTAPHLHFEIRRPDGTALNPWTSLRLSRGLPAGVLCSYGSNSRATPSPASGAGYWLLGSDGGVFGFGGARFHGSMGATRLNQPIVGMAATPTGHGYWLVARDGGVFSFGDARFHGSTGALRLNRPIVGMARTPSGAGYWLVASDGGVFSFGDARFHGSTGALRLNRPIVAMVPTPTGAGYWLLASDGGMFAFGDAAFHGSVPGLGIDTTVVSMGPTASGRGYWLLGADGGVFSFGDAAYRGSVPGIGLCQPPAGVRLVPTATGQGYWVQGADGSTWAFGDAGFHGSLTAAGIRANTAVIDFAAAPPARPGTPSPLLP